jgi:hypothetical protein
VLFFRLVSKDCSSLASPGTENHDTGLDQQHSSHQIQVQSQESVKGVQSI